MLLRHMGNVGIAILICFEERNSFYSMDRGLGNPHINSGRFGKEKTLFTCSESNTVLGSSSPKPRPYTVDLSASRESRMTLQFKTQPKTLTG